MPDPDGNALKAAATRAAGCGIFLNFIMVYAPVTL
jgi:hypothetical protein